MQRGGVPSRVVGAPLSSFPGDRRRRVVPPRPPMRRGWPLATPALRVIIKDVALSLLPAAIGGACRKGWRPRLSYQALPSGELSRPRSSRSHS